MPANHLGPRPLLRIERRPRPRCRDRGRAHAGPPHPHRRAAVLRAVATTSISSSSRHLLVAIVVADGGLGSWRRVRRGRGGEAAELRELGLDVHVEGGLQRLYLDHLAVAIDLRRRLRRVGWPRQGLGQGGPKAIGAPPRWPRSSANAARIRPTARPSARRCCALRSAAERLGRRRLGHASIPPTGVGEEAQKRGEGTGLRSEGASGAGSAITRLGPSWR